MNFPNILTLTRVLLIPIFVILIINKSIEWALLTFAIAGITDGIDGLIARITHQRTELGAYLDPIADKLLLFSAFITLAIVEIIPSWLAVIVITRDVIILVGFLVMVLTSYHEGNLYGIAIHQEIIRRSNAILDMNRCHHIVVRKSLCF